MYFTLLIVLACISALYGYEDSDYLRLDKINDEEHVPEVAGQVYLDLQTTVAELSVKTKVPSDFVYCFVNDQPITISQNETTLLQEEELWDTQIITTPSVLQAVLSKEGLLCSLYNENGLYAFYLLPDIGTSDTIGLSKSNHFHKMVTHYIRRSPAIIWILSVTIALVLLVLISILLVICCKCKQ